MFEKMEETFNLVPAPEAELMDAEDDVEEDGDDELVKTTLRGLITTTNDLLDELSVIAKVTEHPRAYEVAATLIKTVADVAGKLSELNAKTKELAQPATKQITNQNLFVGSTEDLMKMLKDADAFK